MKRLMWFLVCALATSTALNAILCWQCYWFAGAAAKAQEAHLQSLAETERYEAELLANFKAARRAIK